MARYRMDVNLTKKQRAKILWLADVWGVEICFIAERYGLTRSYVDNVLYEERKAKKLADALNT